MKSRLHIVGLSARAGTTLIHELLCACTDASHTGEHEDSLLQPVRSTADLLVTKSPREMLPAVRLLRFCPRLRVIVMIRDPRDVICSVHAQSPGEYHVDAGLSLRQFRFFKRIRRHPRLKAIRYEDLVRDPGGIESELRTWLGDRLGFEHRFDDWHRAARPSENAIRALGSVRPITKSSVGNWRDHPRRIASQIRTHPGLVELVRELGYESSDDWCNDFRGDFDEGDPLKTVDFKTTPPRGISKRLANVPRYLRMLASGGLSA